MIEAKLYLQPGMIGMTIGMVKGVMTIGMAEGVGVMSKLTINTNQVSIWNIPMSVAGKQ